MIHRGERRKKENRKARMEGEEHKAGFYNKMTVRGDQLR